MASATQTSKAKESGQRGEPLEKAKEIGAQAAEKAREGAASVSEVAGQAVSGIGKKADDLTATAGAGVEKWGETIRANSPHEGMMGHASQAVADSLKGGGHYLQEAKFSGMANDVHHLIHRNPVPSVLIGLGLGFILGRALRS